MGEIINCGRHLWPTNHKNVVVKFITFVIEQIRSLYDPMLCNVRSFWWTNCLCRVWWIKLQSKLVTTNSPEPWKFIRYCCDIVITLNIYIVSQRIWDHKKWTSIFDFVIVVKRVWFCLHCRLRWRAWTQEPRGGSPRRWCRCTSWPIRCRSCTRKRCKKQH